MKSSTASRTSQAAEVAAKASDGPVCCGACCVRWGDEARSMTGWPRLDTAFRLNRRVSIVIAQLFDYDDLTTCTAHYVFLPHTRIFSLLTLTVE